MNIFVILFVATLCLSCSEEFDANPRAKMPARLAGQAANPTSKQTEKMMVKVKILGTAQDGGLPQLGCQKAHCQAAWNNPARKRLVTSLAIIDYTSTQVFLVDATPDIREQIHRIQQDADLKLRTAPNPVDGILLTHAHIGHYSGLVHLGFEALSSKKLPVFCTQRMAHFLSQNGPWSQLVRIKNIVLNEMTTDRTFSLTSQITVTALPVPHRDEYSDTVGFLIRGPDKSLLYIPDIDHWRTWDRSLPELLKDVDYAFLDGTFFSPAELPNRDLSKIKHPLITDTMALLQELVDQHTVQIYFTHLNHSNLLQDENSESRHLLKSKGFFMAEVGMEFEL